jgi:16S rRNA G966 N2-methylase RsmD
MSNHIKKLFPNINENLYCKIMIDTVGIYSITKPYEADKISKIIKSIYQKYINNTKTITITDATAGVGGNTLSFCKFFDKVNSIEINPHRHIILLNNLKLYENKNYNSYNMNYLNMYKTITQDIIFIDPPWGGKNYKYKKNININLSNNSINDLILLLKDSCKLIVFKLPLNCNLDDIPPEITKYHIYINKMLILIIAT